MRSICIKAKTEKELKAQLGAAVFPGYAQGPGFSSWSSRLEVQLSVRLLPRHVQGPGFNPWNTTWSVKSLQLG